MACIDSRLITDKTPPKEGERCCYFCDYVRHWGATTGSCVETKDKGRDVFLKKGYCRKFTTEIGTNNYVRKVSL